MSESDGFDEWVKQWKGYDKPRLTEEFRDRPDLIEMALRPHHGPHLAFMAMWDEALATQDVEELRFVTDHWLGRAVYLVLNDGQDETPGEEEK